MRGVEDKWKDKVTFINKSMSDQPSADLMSQLGFNGVPSVVLFDASGRETGRFMGVKTAAEIEALLAKATTK